MADNDKAEKKPEEQAGQPPDYSALDELAQGGEGGEFIPAAEQQQQAASKGAGEVLGGMFMTVFAVAAKVRRDDVWLLSKAEADALGEATDAVLVKYFGEGELPPELALVVVSGSIILPRMLMEKPKETEKKTDTRKAGEGGGESGSKS